MSQANVEVIRGVFEEYAQTGQPVVWHLDRGVLWHTRADLLDSGVHRGHDGFTALWQEWTGSFEDLHAEVEDYIDVGDYVVVPLILRGRIRGSEQDVAMQETWVHKFSDGVVVEVREYPTLAEALEAVERAQ